MARIRSIHPGIFTDENFMQLTADCPLAAVLLPGLWTEADDEGIFEWKPLTLKARILPAVAAAIDPLLEALVENSFIVKFDVAGRFYGAIRNFTKFQRPKKPNPVHPKPEHIRDYVGISSEHCGHHPSENHPSSQPSSPPVPHQFPTSEEIHPQMEDGGWRMEEEISNAVALEVNPTLAEPDECAEAIEVFNAVAGEVGWSKVQRLTAPRKASLKARLRECGGIEGWRLAMARARGSPFLCGDNDRGWRASFDFFLQASSFTKLMEGAYDRSSRASTGPAGRPSGASTIISAMADLVADMHGGG